MPELDWSSTEASQTWLATRGLEIGGRLLVFFVIVLVGWLLARLLVRADLLEQIKVRFDSEGVSFPFPQRDIWLHEVEPENAA